MTNHLTAYDAVGSCWQAIIDEAIERNIRPLATPYLAPILDGYATVVWNNLCREGTDNRAVCDLILALIAQSNRYARHGLSESAADCLWIVDKLKRGDMTVVSNYLLK